jgi:hypothetical protein
MTMNGGLMCVDREVPFARAFDTCQELVIGRIFVPFNLWPILRMLGSKKEKLMAANAKIINEFVYGLIEERKQQKVSSTTMICPPVHCIISFLLHFVNCWPTMV